MTLLEAVESGEGDDNEPEIHSGNDTASPWKTEPHAPHEPARTETYSQQKVEV